MLMAILLAALAFSGVSHAANTCVVVPDSIPAGSVELKEVLAIAEKSVAKPDDLGIAVFGLG